MRYLIALMLLMVGCTAANAPPGQADQDDGVVIHVTSNGWHSGIVVAKEDIPSGRIPETADFPDALFFEFGWGDARFYPSKDVTIGMSMNALLVPTPTVIHMVSLWTEPARYFPKAEIVPLKVSTKNLHALIDFIDASFNRSGAPRAAASAPGLYASSHFYPAHGSFHLLNTCNSWTGRALAAAGFDIEPPGTAQAEALMQQVRALAGSNEPAGIRPRRPK
ncbi:MAG: DUF2459 domain-containing protein [Alphaproteobacteria bacterium]|nr:DUF2459 domain-containing protein [Alphaproteobacteria bacterium]